MLEALALLLLIALFSIISYKKSLLSTTGIIIADIVGGATFLWGGINATIALVVFYAVAEAATLFGRGKGNRHEQRSTSNIAGNAGAAMIALYFGQVNAFFGALSAALADTVSSEIGMLSEKKPRLITSFEKVRKGTDGAITPLGIVSGFLAGGVIAVFYYFTISQSLHMAGLICCAGIIGSVVDSFLGAVFERKGLLSNTQVNFIASLCGAVVVYFGQGLFF